MNTDVKKKWLEALRSGEYSQTKGALRREEGYCCLGVLTDLYVKEKGIKEPWKKGYEEQNYYLCDESGTGKYDGSALLSTEVMEWSGIRESAGAFGTSYLTAENDNGKSFAEIADIIEKEF